MTEQLLDGVKQLKKLIKDKLYERDMSQRDLSELIGEGEAQISKAINGGMNPQSVEIRQKIYKILGIK